MPTGWPGRASFCASAASEIVPLLPAIESGGTAEVAGSVLQVAWPAGDGAA